MYSNLFVKDDLGNVWRWDSEREIISIDGDATDQAGYYAPSFEDAVGFLIEAEYLTDGPTP